MNFGQAVEALKEGKKVSRPGWNGKGMYLTLIQGYPVSGHLMPYYEGSPIPIESPTGEPNLPAHRPGQMLSHIVMRTAGDSMYWGEGYADYVPWLASQTDILSEDWVIVP